MCDKLNELWDRARENFSGVMYLDIVKSGLLVKPLFSRNWPEDYKKLSYHNTMYCRVIIHNLNSQDSSFTSA